MDKELLEMLKGLSEVLEDMLGDEESFKNKLEERINNALNKEEASISIETCKDGKAKTHIEGTNIGVLIALAGLENAVLEQTHAPEGLFELIKKCTRTERAE